MASNSPPLPFPKSWFRNWTKNPDNEEPALVEQRHRQWRQFSRDPFGPINEPKKSTLITGPISNEKCAVNASNGIEEIPYAKPSPMVARLDNTQIKENFECTTPRTTELKHPGPEWVHLVRVRIIYEVSCSCSIL